MTAAVTIGATPDTSAAGPPAGHPASVYGELVTELNWVGEAPMAHDHHLVVAAAAFVAWEARALDERRFEAWLQRWSSTGVMWAPLRRDGHPSHEQTLFLDDHRRLRERVGRFDDPSAWSQHPPSAASRTVGTVEAWRFPDRILIRSAVTIWEHRRGATRAWPAFQLHRLVASTRTHSGDCEPCQDSPLNVFATEIAAKTLVVLGAHDGVPNPAFLL